MSMPRVSIEALTAISLRDGDRPILRQVSLAVDRGEVHGIVGESGAGKSTIAKAILGIIPSQVKLTGGRIAFEGRDLLSLSPNELRLAATSPLFPRIPRRRLTPRGGSRLR
jgi:peptide/nickel transport system ATP-binding protein